MITRPHVDWFAITPELILLGVSAILLLGAVLVPVWARRGFSALIAAAGFLAAFVAAIVLYVQTPDGGPAIADALFRDRFGALAQVIVCGAALLTVGVSWAERLRDDHVGEFYALLAAAAAGMVFFVTAGNLMTLFLSLEWFSICLYVLCPAVRPGSTRPRRSYTRRFWICIEVISAATEIAKTPRCAGATRPPPSRT